MKKEDKKYYENCLTITTGSNWEEFVEETKKEIYQEQVSALETCQTIEQLHERRGYLKGLSRIVNLREDTIAILEQSALEESQDGV